VVRQVDDGGGVRDRAVLDGQRPLLVERVAGGDVQPPGIAALARLAAQRQQHAAVLRLRHLPQAAMEGGHAAAVQMVVVVVALELVLPPFELEAALRDAVGVPPDRAAEVVPMREVRGRRVVPQHDVRARTGRVRYPQGLQRRAERQHRGFAAPRVRQRDGLDLQALIQAAEGPDRRACHAPDGTIGPMSTPATRDVYSVGRLNREARMLLEAGLPTLWVEGEISNFAAPASGHWYFSLKDRDAQIRCAMFRTRNMAVGFRPRDGQHLVARGRVSLYEPRGDYQLIVEMLEDAGEGALKREFEKLRARLNAEGLFDTARKRPLPALPKRIGVITSPTGAAIRDILHILARRYPAAPVLIYPVPVQGEAAPMAIAHALELANLRADCDVLILARGGGSLEDLWSFNDERVARAIFASRIPVVSGVGHEIDFTIADFVADVRAPTPSGAAELVVPDGRELLARLRAQHGRLALAMSRQLTHAAQQHAHLLRRLQQVHPGTRMTQRAQRLDEIELRLGQAVLRTLQARRVQLQGFAGRLQRVHAGVHVLRLTGLVGDLGARLAAAATRQVERQRQRLALAQRGLDAVSPLAVLARGYAVVTTTGGAVLQDAAAVRPGEEITVRLARGSVSARVIEAQKKGA
jgi:exodeoxyribonuclease VII large subunit